MDGGLRNRRQVCRDCRRGWVALLGSLGRQPRNHLVEHPAYRILKAEPRHGRRDVVLEQRVR